MSSINQPQRLLNGIVSEEYYSGNHSPVRLYKVKLNHGEIVRDKRGNPVLGKRIKTREA